MVVHLVKKLQAFCIKRTCITMSKTKHRQNKAKYIYTKISNTSFKVILISIAQYAVLYLEVLFQICGLTHYPNEAGVCSKVEILTFL